MLFKNIVLYPFLIFSSALISSADEPVRRGAEPSIEEELRRHLRKLDRWNLMQLLRVERDVDAKQKKRAEVSSNPDELAILAEDEDRGVRFYVASNRHASLDVQLLLAQDLVQLESGLVYSLAVRGVHDVNQRLRVLVVVAPVRPDGFLPADVPHVELEPRVQHGLDVEPLRRGGGRDVLVRQLTQDGGLAGVIETQNQDACLVVNASHGARSRTRVSASGKSAAGWE